MKLLLIVVAAGLAGCGTMQANKTEQRQARRDAAMVAYGGGALVGFAGCIAGFATLSPIALPFCLGGWLSGVSGIGYLAWDDSVGPRP